MGPVLVYSPALASYDLGAGHPLRPERFTLAVALMEAYGLVPAGTIDGEPADTRAPLAMAAPEAASDEDLLAVHSPEYVEAVRESGSGRVGVAAWGAGLGTADTPVFPGMHEAAALVAGATIGAVALVTEGVTRRSFSIAGGLHHAHRDRAAGFCVYNDAAIGIARALRRDPGLRVAYVDIDAHHGDGVQEAFYEEPRVLTVSLHETGEALFPGTGFPEERGSGPGLGYAVNVPLPPDATDACYRLAFDEALVPAVRGFRPDLLVAQCGADALRGDPLTSLGMTLGGHRSLVRSIVALADDLCDGRLVALGGGGYSWRHEVPRAWTAVAAELAGVAVPDALPEAWRARVRRVTGADAPRRLADDGPDASGPDEARLLRETVDVLAELARAGVPAPSERPEG